MGEGFEGDCFALEFFSFLFFEGFYEVVSILLSFSRKQKDWDDSDDFSLGKE